MKNNLKYILFALLPFGIIAFVIYEIVIYLKKRAKMATYEVQYIWKNFDLTELDTTKNGATKQQIANMKVLVDNTLQPLRDLYGMPIHVNSGIRDYIPSGGSKTSHHLQGFAVDVEGWNYFNSENLKLLKVLLSSDLPFTQVIYEFGGNWIHIAYTGENKKQILISEGSKSAPTYKQVSKEYILNL